MGLNINLPQYVSGINSNISFSPNGLRFGNSQSVDSFKSESARRFINEEYLNNAIVSNPDLKKLIQEINSSTKINVSVLQELSENHFKTTQEIAEGIIKNLPKALREHVNVKSVKDAAYLHDLGKVLIPPEILHKNGELTENEKKIMHRHSEIGYELLKNSDIDTRTLHLIKYHHQNMSHSGYPKVKDDFFADINLQILSIADKYSALTEPRSYKEAYDSDKALAILYKDVYEGNIHPFVYKALSEYVKSGKSEYQKNMSVIE